MTAFAGGTEEQSEEEVRRVIVTAVHSRRPVRAMYQEQEREFCPHVIGRNRIGQWRVFAYQYGGTSRSGLAGEGGWRCLAVSGLSRVAMLDDSWHTAPHERQQRCVIHVEADADYPEAPQNGQ